MPRNYKKLRHQYLQLQWLALLLKQALETLIKKQYYCPLTSINYLVVLSSLSFVLLLLSPVNSSCILWWHPAPFLSFGVRKHTQWWKVVKGEQQGNKHALSFYETMQNRWSTWQYYQTKLKLFFLFKKWLNPSPTQGLCRIHFILQHSIYWFFKTEQQWL